MRIPEQWFNELEDLTEVDNTIKTSYTDNIETSNGETTMTLSQTAYQSMLIARVAQGKLSPRKATQLFNQYMEANQ